MLRYLVGAAVGALGLYGVQQFWAASNAGLDLKVGVDQTHIPPNNDPYDVLYVQSREDKPIVLKRVDDGFGIYVNHSG